MEKLALSYWDILTIGLPLNAVRAYAGGRVRVRTASDDPNHRKTSKHRRILRSKSERKPRKERCGFRLSQSHSRVLRTARCCQTSSTSSLVQLTYPPYIRSLLNARQGYNALLLKGRNLETRHILQQYLMAGFCTLYINNTTRWPSPYSSL